MYTIVIFYDILHVNDANKDYNNNKKQALNADKGNNDVNCYAINNNLFTLSGSLK